MANMDLINSYSLDELRSELAREIDLRLALVVTFRDLPENPSLLALRALCNLASWERDHVLGKKIQSERGIEVVPPKSEYEDAAGLWARIRPVLANPTESANPLLEEAVSAERARCAAVVKNLARAVRQHTPDPDPANNTPEAICELHGVLALCAAAAIEEGLPPEEQKP